MEAEFTSIETDILVIRSNRWEIERVLRAAGGEDYPREFCYEHFYQIWGVVRLAQEQALEILGSGMVVHGVRIVARSGRAVPADYTYPRKSTEIELVRRSGGWHLIRASGCLIGAGGGSVRMIITPAQERRARMLLLRKFGVTVEDITAPVVCRTKPGAGRVDLSSILRPIGMTMN